MVFAAGNFIKNYEHDFIHAMKPSPITNVQDANRVFDFLQSQPWSTNMITYIYSKFGVPTSYREQDGFGVHAYKFYDENGDLESEVIYEHGKIKHRK